MVFSVEERERIRDRLVEMAHSDPRVVGCALVGADARGETDRWSDVDLTMAVDFGAVHLFDLPVATTLYRVFLFRGNLQVDLSFTPETDFVARGPHFRLVFGTVGEAPPVEPPSAKHLFGLAVHHAVRARFCVERGLETAYGRGFDGLPAALLGEAERALVRSPAREDLLRALGAAVDLLLRHPAEDAEELAGQLRELADPDGVYA